MTTSPPSDQRARLLPLVMLIVLGSLWGLGFSLAKFATMGGIHPVAFSFWQSVVAGAVLSAVAALRGVHVSLSARHVRFYLVMGLIGFTIPNVNITVAVSHLPVGIAAVVVPLAPLFTTAMAYFIGLERLSWGRTAGIALGLLGTALIALPQSAMPVADQTFWVVLATFTPFFYALGNIVAAKFRPPDVGSGALAAAMHVLNAAALLPLVLVLGAFAWPWEAGQAAQLALYAQMVIACIVTALFLEIVRLAGPVFLSQAAYVVTTTGVLWGMVLFGERHGAHVWAAIALVFAGVLLVQRTGARAA